MRSELRSSDAALSLLLFVKWIGLVRPAINNLEQDPQLKTFGRVIKEQDGFLYGCAFATQCSSFAVSSVGSGGV